MEDRVSTISIETELKTSFLDYSMSVLVSRALPDVRDGLKPVHRRILFAMQQLKNFHNRPYLKSARIVGDVLGKYHPHSDTSVYDALVRMAQDFSLRYPLVDGQGNFGSVDGDSAASMRYTESRMHEISEFLLQDLDKETVNFSPNYDNKEMEPDVLPSMLPQLLINGSSGIAVGMATNIPPHNLGEVLSGLLAVIENPEISLPELMQHVRGPDFPTGAEIHGVRGIRDGYETGRGSVIMRSKYVVEQASGGKERLVVTEIPFQVNKSRLIERIAELVKEKKVEGIQDLRDESSREGIRIVIEVKKGEMPEVIINNLFKLTPLQTSFGMNMIALVRGIPKLLSLKSMLEEFYQHRREVVLRRSLFLLRRNEEKAHILQGLKIALDNVEDVIALIRAAPDSATAGEELRRRYGLSEAQAKAILEMRLSRLTGLEREKIEVEHKELLEKIADLRDILQKPERVTAIILEEISLLRERFSDERKTSITLADADGFSMESLVADEEVAVTVTSGGYVKRTASDEIVAQKRGGKGKSGMLMREDDFIQNVFITNNHADLLCFSNKGKVYSLKVYQIPEATLRSRGQHFANLVKLEAEEKIVSVLSVKEFQENRFIFCATERGVAKKMDLMAFANVRANGLIGLRLEEGDNLISCLLVSPGDEILLATKYGKAIRFPESDVRAMGRNAHGVTGIRFSSEEPLERVIGAEVLVKEEGGAATFILSVCENGYGKRTDLGEYRAQSRGGKGVYTIKVTERNGPVVGICQVKETDDLMVMTSSGKLTRFAVSDINVIGRLTQGVRLMTVENERVIAISKVPSDGKEPGEPEVVE